MRGLFVLAMTASTVFSFASYDLVLVLDNDPSGPQVKRFDGQSGAYFGSFGLGILSGSLSIACDVNSSTALVGAGNGLKLFNYSTGDYIGITSGVAGRSVTFGSGYYYAVGTSSTNLLFRVSPAGTVLSTQMPYSALWSWVTTGIDGSLLIGDAATGDIYRTTSAAPSTASWTRIFDGAAALFSPTNPAVVSYSYGTIGYATPETNLITAAGTWMWIDWPSTYTGITSTGAYAMSPFTSISGMALAHLGTYVVGMNGATAQAVRYDNFHYIANTFGTTQLKAPVAVTTALAPEPAALLVTLGGISSLALLRRRRRKV